MVSIKSPLFYILFAALITSVACVKKQSEEQATISESVFSNAVQTFKVSVYYEEGAEPYDGNIGLSTDETWDITEASYQELFKSFGERNYEIPKNISEMQKIASQNEAQWTTSMLRELGNQIHSSWKTESLVDLGIIFLKGNFNGNNAVIGIHVTGTPFAFVFKDIVSGVGGTAAQQRYVEQAVVVHELGHTVGLVNNGIPLSSDHEDSEHPGHTGNSEGVMYWAVENGDEILDFVSTIVGGAELQLFGPESLEDAMRFNP